MRKRNVGKTAMAVIMTALLLMSVGVAFSEEKRPLTPQHAAKKHMIDKQNEQRVTPAKKKAAADALKAERVKIYQAKEAAKMSNPSK